MARRGKKSWNTAAMIGGLATAGVLGVLGGRRILRALQASKRTFNVAKHLDEVSLGRVQDALRRAGVVTKRAINPTRRNAAALRLVQSRQAKAVQNAAGEALDEYASRAYPGTSPHAIAAVKKNELGSKWMSNWTQKPRYQMQNQASSSARRAVPPSARVYTRDEMGKFSRVERRRAILTRRASLAENRALRQGRVASRDRRIARDQALLARETKRRRSSLGREMAVQDLIDANKRTGHLRRNLKNEEYVKQIEKVRLPGSVSSQEMAPVKNIRVSVGSNMRRKRHEILDRLILEHGLKGKKIDRREASRVLDRLMRPRKYER